MFIGRTTPGYGSFSSTLGPTGMVMGSLWGGRCWCNDHRLFLAIMLMGKNNEEWVSPKKGCRKNARVWKSPLGILLTQSSAILSGLVQSERYSPGYDAPLFCRSTPIRWWGLWLFGVFAAQQYFGCCSVMQEKDD